MSYTLGYGKTKTTTQQDIKNTPSSSDTYTFGYGKAKTTQDIRNIPGSLNRGFVQQSEPIITPKIPTTSIVQKTTGIIPKPILKAVSSDSLLLKSPLAPIVSKIFPSGFGKETDRLRKRFLDSASFGITGEADKALGKDVSYRDGRSFKNDKVGATLDTASTLGGYLIPGLGLAKGAKAVGLGAKSIPKLAKGATKTQQLVRLGKIAGQQAKEGIAIGAAISGSEIGVREAINPDSYSAKDNISKLAVDTLSGAILDPAVYAGGKLIGKGLSKIFKNVESNPQTQQVLKDIESIKNTQEVKDAAKNLDYISPLIENKGYRSGTFKPNEISEGLSQQTGNRGTGHFGTGHYFFGSKNLAESFRPSENKPVTEINLNNLNLFRPKTEKIGYDLHNALKEANNKIFIDKNSEELAKTIKLNLDKNLNDTIKINELNNINVKNTEEFINDFLDEDFKGEFIKERYNPEYFDNQRKYFIRNLKSYLTDDFIKSNNLEIPKNKYEVEYRKKLDELSKFDEYNFDIIVDYEKLNSLEITKLYKREEERLNKIYENSIPLKKINSIANNYYNDFIEPYFKTFISDKNILNFIEKFKNVMNENGISLNKKQIKDIEKILKQDISSLYKNKDLEQLKFEDSVSTKIMKYLGYDGVDVRGLKGLDNEEYGSVIYANIKKPKIQKITVKKQDLQKSQKIKSQILNKEKLLNKKIVRDFKENNNILSKSFSKKTQTIGDTTLVYPTSTADIINPEIIGKKARFGQITTLLPQGSNYNNLELLNKEEIIRLSDIVRKFKEGFGIKYSTKNAGRGLKRALGFYKPISGRIKTRAYDDIQTLAHEFAHYLSFGKYNIFKKLENEYSYLKNDINLESKKYIENAGWTKVYKPNTRKYFEEGLAEFTRRYFFYPEFEAKDSPAFLELLDNILTKEDKKKILKLQDDIKKFASQNRLERLYSEISFGKKKKIEFPTFNKLKENLSNFMENFYTWFVDEQRPLEKILKPYGKKGEEVFREIRLVKGSAEKARQWLEEGVTNDKGDIVEDSLTKILEPVQNNIDEFIIYIINKRAIDLINRGFNVGNKALDSDRMAVIQDLENKFPEFINAQKKLINYQRLLLSELIKAEKISTKEFSEMFAKNPNYVPYYRDYDLDELSPSQAKSFGLVPTIFRMKGDTREIINPLESIIKNTYSFIYIAEKNKAINSFIDRIYRTGDTTILAKTGKFIEKLEVPTKVTNFKLKEIRKEIFNQFNEQVEAINDAEIKAKNLLEDKLLNGKISEQQYDDAINAIEEHSNNQINAIENVFENFNYDAMAKIFRPNPSVVKNKDYVITISKNVRGKIKKEFYQLSPDLYNAITLSDSRNLGVIFNALSLPTRIFRTGITSTFEFWFKNLFRDQFSYAINSKSGYVPYVDLIRGMFHIFGKSNEYQRFLSSGAGQSFRSTLDRNYLKEDLRKIIKEKSKLSAMNIIKNPLEIVERASQFIETSSKVGNFAKGLKKFEGKGKTELQITKEAALDSRDLIDFARRGSVGKRINAVSAFFNSAIQGLDKTIRVFKDPATRNQALGKGIIYITLPTISLYLANRENPKYQELQDWDKDLFWHFWINDVHYRLPIPFELGVIFKVIPERIMSTLDQTDKPWSGFGKTVMNTFNFVPANPANGFGITLLSPIIQSLSNTNYFGSKIVPVREQFLPPEEKFGYNTSESAKLIGKIVSKIPGYRDIKSLEILATPRYVDNMVQGYFGTLGQYGLMALDIVLKPFDSLKKPFPEAGELPLFKAFIAKEISNTKSFDEFYTELSRLRESYNTSLKNKTEFLEYQRKNAFERAAKNLQEFTKLEKQIRYDDTLSPKEKQKSLIKLHQIEMNYIRQFLGKPMLNQYLQNKNN